MNKDIIYIEPEDDITDVIAKIKSAKKKVVALVPGQKLGILASAINVKLIAKVAKTASKAVVLVTDNPSLMKLCASVELPVAATLQTRPAVPTVEDIEAAAAVSDRPTVAEEAEAAEAEAERDALAEDFVSEPEKLDTAAIEDELAAKSVEADAIELTDTDDDDDDTADDESDAQSDDDSDQTDSQDKTANAKSPAKKSKVPDLKKQRKYILAGAISAILLVVLLVWALVFAPAATINVVVGTVKSNFSENVSFTKDAADADAKAGRFQLDAYEYKETLSGQLTATGEKDVGEKAKGTAVISYTFSNSNAVTLKAGSSLIYNNLQYTTAKDLTLSPGDCTVNQLNSGKCSASATVEIVAIEAGEKYNLEKGVALSSKTSGFTASSSTAIAGGSSKIVKIVQQSDIDAAVSSLTKLSESEAKGILKEEISQDSVIIDSSYSAQTSEVKSSAQVGAEAGSDATVSVEVTYSIYAVDAARIEEYIREKASLAADQKIYDLGSPYIERFTVADGGAITGKLKTTYKSGPEVTSDAIMAKVQGRKVGEAQSMLKSINGIDSVDIKTSFFWVNSIPSDPNKITINIEVRE